jgi:murein DD-endopeptidase MepM/ murein hydrolase activator NlpD
MAKKEKSNGNASNKKKVFRLVILDNETLKQHFSFVLSKGNLFAYMGTIIIIIGVLTALLLVFTPLKYLMPPVENFSLEKKIIQNKLLIDSLEKEIVYRDNYFSEIQRIINNENIEELSYVDTNQNRKLLTKKEQDSILNALIERDKEAYEEISNDINNSIDNINFYAPLTGFVSNKFDVAAEHYGVDIVAPENTPISAVLDGTVILAAWTVNTGYIIEIQHTNNFVSVYKHNGELLKKEGETVKAGEPIALVGNTGELTTGPHLHFELWQNGQPIDPEKYINF